MKSRKSPGFDDIPAELIKETGEMGIKVIHKLCNRIWSTKEWPEYWTKAVFTILPEKGGMSKQQKWSVVSWPSGLAYRTQVLVLAAECGFESQP